MSITEILKNTEESKVKIKVEINLDDLREWRAEMMEELRHQIDNAKESDSDDKRLTPSETCRELGITRDTLVRWDRAELIPRYKIGRKVWYLKSDVNAFILRSKKAKK